MRVEKAHGARTEITGDTLFASSSYRGRLTLTTAPHGTAAATAGRSELRLVDGHVFVHVPGMGSAGEFLSQDPSASTQAVVGLCACLFSHLEPRTMLETMRQSLTSVDYLGQERRAGVSLEHYRLDADSAKIPGAVDAAHPATTRVYQVWLDARHLLHRMTYSTVDETVAVTYSRWGERVRVQRPAATRIHGVPTAGGTGT